MIFAALVEYTALLIGQAGALGVLPRVTVAEEIAAGTMVAVPFPATISGRNAPSGPSGRVKADDGAP